MCLRFLRYISFLLICILSEFKLLLVNHDNVLKIIPTPFPTYRRTSHLKYKLGSLMSVKEVDL